MRHVFNNSPVLSVILALIPENSESPFICFHYTTLCNYSKVTTESYSCTRGQIIWIHDLYAIT